MGSLATVEHYNSEHQYEHTRHQSRGTQEDGGPPGTSPGARMVGDPAYPSSAAGPGADPRRGLRTRTRGELRQRRGGGRRSRRRGEKVATPEGGGGWSDTARDDGCRRSGTPESHSEEVCRAAEETRKRFRDREPSDEEQQRGGGRGATAVEAPAEDSWEVPLTTRYAAEEPSPRSEDGDEPCAPSPPRWLPEVPPTPRYEGEWLTDDARDGDRGAPLATPPWRPARPPTPRYMEPQRPEEQTPSEESTAQPMPQPQEEEVHQARAEEPSVVRTEVPAAHVSHSTR
nr:DNA translocase FtsK-like [Drosophila suzukii]